jgi:xylulokinase
MQATSDVRRSPALFELSAMEACSLGIDLGTGSAKAVVLNRLGTQLGSATVPVELAEPQPGWVESDPEEWWLAVKSSVRQVLGGTNMPIGAIGLSGQMHGVVLASSNGRTLRPAIISLDRRALGDLDAYRALPAGQLSSLGNPLVPGMAGPLLHWLAAHEPQVLEQADWALQPKDWLRLRLVGEGGSEPSDASGTLLFDLRYNSWALPVAEALGIPPSLLAPLGRAASVAGQLQGAAARELGLPRGIPVAFGAADTAAALVGTGISRVGNVQLTVGSAAQVVTLRSRPEPDPGLRYHLFASAEEGLWYALAAVQVAGVALTWVLRTYKGTWEEAYEHLGASPLGARGALFVPHLAGARSPSMNSRAKAGFAGLELAQSRADIFRAAFEGVAFSIAEAAAALPEFPEASVVYLAGGGTLHRAWRQLLCDVLGKTLLVLDHPNASARGAALLGGRAANIIEDIDREPQATDKVEPDAAAHRALAEIFERWKAVATALAPDG